MAAGHALSKPMGIALALTVLAAGAYFSRLPWQSQGGSVPEAVADQAASSAGAPNASVAGSRLPPSSPASSPISPAAMRAALAEERRVSARPEAQAPKTYIGPDGKPHEIVYNQSFILTLTPVEREQYEAEMLDQLKQDPEGFARLYNLDLKFVEDVAAGRKPFPSAVLQ